jgi:hypothetical protein
MTVYVDALAPRGWRLGESAHLLADTPHELHDFAARLGLRRAWFQPRSSPHYDLTARRHQKALELGAVLLDRRSVVRLIRRLRAAGSRAPARA